MKYLWVITRFAIYGFLCFACLGALLQNPLNGQDLLWKMIFVLGALGSIASVLSCCASIAIKLVWQELMAGKNCE